MKTLNLSQTDTIKAAELLNEGKIVAIPTDTVYGLAVKANQKEAIKHLRELKHRPDEKALAYMVDSLEKIEAVCELTERDRQLINHFLPGPLTFIFKKKENDLIVDESGYDTLAIRIPNHPFIIEMISYMEIGCYVPSANISSFPPAKNSQEVLESFDEKIEAVVEGEAYQGLASTIVDCSKEELVCLREGAFDFKEIVNYEKNL